MKRLSAVAAFLLGMSSALSAQKEIPAPMPAPNDNVAMDFAQTSAASQPSVRSDLVLALSVTNFSNSFGANSLADSGTPARSSALATVAPVAAAEAASPAAPAVPVPSYDYAERENRWQLGLGVALVRFRSSVYYATAVGLNSSLSYSKRARTSSMWATAPDQRLLSATIGSIRGCMFWPAECTSFRRQESAGKMVLKC